AYLPARLNRLPGQFGCTKSSTTGLGALLATMGRASGSREVVMRTRNAPSTFEFTSRVQFFMSVYRGATLPQAREDIPNERYSGRFTQQGGRTWGNASAGA